MPYIEFTDSQKQRAAAVDLEAFLLSRGERLLLEGRESRLASDHSGTNGLTTRQKKEADLSPSSKSSTVSATRRPCPAS